MIGREADGQCVFLCIFSMLAVFHFPSTVGHEVEGPLWAVMAALEARADGLGSFLGLEAAVLSLSQALCGRS